MNTKLPKGVRLPAIPANLVPISREPAAPPPQQLPPTLGVSSTYEAQTKLLEWPLNIEQSVYITQRRWRACDVYVKLPDDLSLVDTFNFSIFVYAVAQGTRTLVASGRVDWQALVDGYDQPKQRWIAAARAVAERYEVTGLLRQPDADTPLPGRMTVTVVAADEMTEPPQTIGSFARFSNGAHAIRFNNALYPAPPRLEVLEVRGVNTAAAERYLQLYDSAITGLPGVGDVPKMVWPLGNAAGQGFSAQLAYRCMQSPILLVSSTAPEYTPPGDGEVGITVR